MITNFKLFLESKKEDVKYDCIMLYADISKKEWKTYLDIIDEKDLYLGSKEDIEKDEYGYENESHITLLYGIHSDEVNKDDVYKWLKSLNPIEIELKNISIFENEDYDVVKIDIKPTKELLKYRKYAINNFPNTQTYDEYHPHMTLAYVKKGKGEKYIQELEDNKTLIFNKAVYSDYMYKKKYFKLEDNKINESYNSNYIPRIKIKGEFYHGTIIQDHELITHLTTGYSDYDAIWFSDNEEISEEFGKEKIYDNDKNNEIVAVYKLYVNTSKIADINYDLAKKLTNKYELDDFREIIDILKQKDFNGWKTTGSIGYDIYDDYAIFYDDLIEIESVKLLINDNFTDYMSLDEAQELLEKLEED